MRRTIWIAVALASALALGFAAGRWSPSGPRTQGEPAAAGGPPGLGAAENPSAEPAAGKWRPARTPGPGQQGEAADEAARRAPEALLAVPYLQGYHPADDGARTVTVRRPEAVSPGLNFYTSGHAPEAVLLDMAGRTLHRWRYGLRDLRPELYAGPEAQDRIRKLEYFRRARLLPTGEVLAVFEGLGLIKLDADSNLLWAYRGGAHHDLDLAEDGRIFLLDREGREIPRLRRGEAVLEDLVTVLSPDGRVLRRISILEAFERSLYAPLLHRIPPGPDVFHTNTLEILDGRLAHRSPAFRRGNLLLSVLTLDTVAVLDPEREEIVWALTGPWRKQHQPTVVGDGSLLIFDNLGAGPDRSRVLELDPFSQEVLWRYGGDPGTDLFSKTLGSVQRLPNGNTLVTESENGRALEVTPAEEIAWEFRSPHRAGDDDELVAALFEMERLPPDFPFPGLGPVQFREREP